MSLLGLLVVVLVAALICWGLSLLPGRGVPPRIVLILQLLVVIFVLILQLLVVIFIIVWIVSAVFGSGPVIRVG
jgi:hypothetical protein